MLNEPIAPQTPCGGNDAGRVARLWCSVVGAREGVFHSVDTGPMRPRAALMNPGIASMHRLAVSQLNGRHWYTLNSGSTRNALLSLCPC